MGTHTCLTYFRTNQQLATRIIACCLTHLKFWEAFRERLFISCTMEIKLAGFSAKVATSIGKQTAVYLYAGAIPGLKGSKEKAHFLPNITEIVSLSVAIFC